MGFGAIPKLHLGSYNGSEMAPQAFAIARNGLGKMAAAEAVVIRVQKPRQLSDVVSASACSSPPIRPFSAS